LHNRSGSISYQSEHAGVCWPLWSTPAFLILVSGLPSIDRLAGSFHHLLVPQSTRKSLGLLGRLGAFSSPNANGPLSSSDLRCRIGGHFSVRRETDSFLYVIAVTASCIEALTAGRTDHQFKVDAPDFLRLNNPSTRRANDIEAGEDLVQIDLLTGWHGLRLTRMSREASEEFWRQIITHADCTELSNRAGTGIGESAPPLLPSSSCLHLRAPPKRAAAFCAGHASSCLHRPEVAHTAF